METVPQGGTTTSRRFDSAEQEAYLALWRTYDRLRMHEDAFFAAHDLTNQQYNVLRLLRADYPEAVPTLQLVGRLVSRAPDVTRMLDKLVQRGIVERSRPEHNRRTVLVKITEAGLALLDKLAEPLRDCHRKQLGHLEPQELEQLIELLRAARLPHETEDSPWR